MKLIAVFLALTSLAMAGYHAGDVVLRITNEVSLAAGEYKYAIDGESHGIKSDYKDTSLMQKNGR